MGSNCDNRIYLRRHTSLGYSSHGNNILCRFLQASRWLSDGCHHGQQERMGLWFRRIYYAMDYQGRVCAPDHDKYELDNAMVLVCDSILLLW